MALRSHPCRDELLGWQAKQFGDAALDFLLKRMVLLQVALQRPAHLSAGRKKGGVFTRAVVLERAVPQDGTGHCRWLASRSAFQSSLKASLAWSVLPQWEAELIASPRSPTSICAAAPLLMKGGLETV